MKNGVDCYITLPSAEALGVSGHRLHIIEPLRQFDVGDFSILPFPVQHDVPGVGYLIVHRPTGSRLLFATDTYYIHNRFDKLNFILIECNYCKDILYQNIEAGLIPAGMKDRLLQSHFELENVKRFLQANVSADTRLIVLLHLSDGNSNAERMVREITELTGIETVVAEPGEIELDLFPF